MVTALGGSNPNPRNGRGVPKGPFGFIVFPGSHAQLSWPLDPAAINQTAQGLLNQAGGLAAFNAAFV
jgi:hypothetical protein